MGLENYQVEFKNAVYAAWNEGHRNVLATMATGLGKSYTVGHIVQELNQPTNIIAHRNELVSQLSLALADRGIRHAITLPPKNIKDIAKHHIDQLGRAFYDARSHVRVVSVQSLDSVNDRDAPWLAQAKFWITDECFVAGTPIATTRGPVPINRVRVGDEVRSFDIDTGGFVIRRVTATMKNPYADYLVKLKTPFGVTWATPGHPYLSTEGWKDAGEIKCGDYVYGDPLHRVCGDDSISKNASKLPVSKNRTGVLQTLVRACLPRPESQADDKETLPQTVRAMRRDDASYLRSTNKTRLLLKNLFDRFSQRHLVDHDGRDQPAFGFRADAEKEPYALRTNAPEDAQITKRNPSSPLLSRRKRPRPNRTRDRGFCSAATVWVHDQLRRAYQKAERQWVPALLQAGFGQRAFENRRGGGRKQPCESSATGREEGRAPCFVGVESVSFHKLGGADQSSVAGFDGYVYNLEVEGTHTYVANGIVVHNCHHLLAKNIWGRAVQRMPHALGLGVTATPIRAEGAGLGRAYDGVFDTLVEGPQLADGIEWGFLTSYRLVCPREQVEIDDSLISSATGDYNQFKLREVIHDNKTLNGSIVTTWKRFAEGKQTIVFAVDIEESSRIAARFREAGVTAQAVSSKTPADLRAQLLRNFREKRLTVLVNVDLFGEGFDVPGIEVVVMARPTASLSLFMQQVGRALRLQITKEQRALWPSLPSEARKEIIAKSEKPYALIIDHVGNIQRHNLPCQRRSWSLERREKKSRGPNPDVIPLRYCVNEICCQPYERHLTECPYCGEPSITKSAVARTELAEIDGDMVLLDPRDRAVMEAEVRRVDGDPHFPQGASLAVVNSIRRNHKDRQMAQRDLRQAIAAWAGRYHFQGEDDRAIHKRFYLSFGVDILSAMALGTADALKLKERITPLTY